LSILSRLSVRAAMLITEMSIPTLSRARFSIGNSTGKFSLFNVRLLKLVYHFASDSDFPILNLKRCQFASKTKSFLYTSMTAVLIVGRISWLCLLRCTNCLCAVERSLSESFQSVVAGQPRKFLAKPFHCCSDDRTNSLTLRVDTFGHLFSGFMRVENGKTRDETHYLKVKDNLQICLFTLRNPDGIPPQKSR
jgi:hypothetical protein